MNDKERKQLLDRERKAIRKIWQKNRKRGRGVKEWIRSLVEKFTDSAVFSLYKSPVDHATVKEVIHA
jgi:hypothetical protein